ARQTIEKLEEVIKKVTSPANRIGTFLGNVGKETAHIVVSGADYYCNVDPRIPMAKLKKGTRVLVNEAFVIVGDLGFEPAGPVTKITEVIGTDRLRVGNEHGTQSLVLQRSAQLAKTALKQGDEVRVDSNYRMALEMMTAPGSHEHYLDNVPELPWTKVGGQERAIEAIKDAIELPLLHPHWCEKFSRRHATNAGKGSCLFSLSTKRRAFSGRGAPHVTPTFSRPWCRCSARKWTESIHLMTSSSFSLRTAPT